MIPLPHISWFFCSFFAFLIVRQLYLAHRKGSKDENLNYFLGAFTLLAIFFLLVSLPALLSNQASFVQILYLLSWLSLFPIPFFMLRIFSSIWHFPTFKNIALPLAILLMAIFAPLNILFFSPAKIKIFETYWYWSEGTPMWLQVSGGGLLGLLILFVGCSFIIGGFRSKERLVRARSLFIGWGMISLFLGTISSYGLYFFSPVLVIFSGFLSLLGIVLLYLGICFTNKENR